MKIGILGYGKEGQSAEKYFTQHGDIVQIFDHFTNAELESQDFSNFDLILRSPSVHPQPNFSSMTRYFFEHCPCPIIGVTGTKGKGTTCSLITAILQNLNQNVHLIGNIGTPALDVLDQLTPQSIVVYEMSSFQLWDLRQSPHIAVVLGIKADHLNVHDGYDDYVSAKANIVKYQSADDYCIYYQNNPDSVKIAAQSPAHKLPYPLKNRESLDELLKHLAIPGQHNRENAEAALLAVASYYNLPLLNFIAQHRDAIIKALTSFQGLPHRLQFLRTLNGVDYYDDNFCTNLSSLQVALQAFPNHPIVLIAGGRDKTNNADLPKIAQLIQQHQATRTILIGESGQALAKLIPGSLTATSLADAVIQARTAAESTTHSDPQSSPIVLMSPAAASFDMFENVYDRGAQFQNLVQELS